MEGWLSDSPVYAGLNDYESINYVFFPLIAVKTDVK
jgi:hypothetical protein